MTIALALAAVKRQPWGRSGDNPGGRQEETLEVLAKVPITALAEIPTIRSSLLVLLRSLLTETPRSQCP